MVKIDVPDSRTNEDSLNRRKFLSDSTKVLMTDATLVGMLATGIGIAIHGTVLNKKQREENAAKLREHLESVGWKATIIGQDRNEQLLNSDRLTATIEFSDGRRMQVPRKESQLVNEGDVWTITLTERGRVGLGEKQ